MEDSLFLREPVIHSDWLSFLTDENRLQVFKIEEQVVKSGFTPGAGQVLRFLSFPLSSAKIIILGQDPYPQAGAATGRAFEVGTLTSWNQPFRNTSLKNILRAVYQAYSGQVITFNELREKLDNEFPVLPPGKLFINWENQGVLLLNTAFTCQPGNPGSHREYWAEFTGRLLAYVHEKAPRATWFLWGSQAREATKHIKLQRKIESMHPMMCHEATERNTDFLYGEINCFEKFLEEIDWTGFGLKKGVLKESALF